MVLLPLLWRVMAGPYDWRTLGSTGVGCEAELYVNDKSIMVREPGGAPYCSGRHDKNRCAANDVRGDVSVIQKRELRYVRC